jgi:hypothetical protein
LSYQWYRGASPISGATSSSYSLLAQYPGDEGASFHLTVTNSLGSINSDAVTLTVLTNLNILDPYSPITRTVGSKAAFRVVGSGAQPISYQWFKGTTLLPGETNDTVWVNNVQQNSAGAYHARVTGPFDAADSAEATLLVQNRGVNVPVTGYAKIILADDPVAYWRLDEPDGSETAIDAVGSFDGTYAAGAGVLESTNGIPVDTNPALRLMGGGTVSIPYALELNPVSGPWSFEAWIKPAIQPGDFATAFSSMRVAPGQIFGWNLYQHAASAWTMNLFNGGTGGSFNSDFFDIPLVIDAWYHVIIADDLTTVRFFVNGVQRASQNRQAFGFIPNGMNGDPATGGATVLGHRGDSAFLPFDGMIDEVAVYNKALTVEQANAHYRASTTLTVSRADGNVVLRWSLGELQSASSVQGQYTAVTPAISPYYVPPSDPQRYYRVQVSP